MGSRNTYSQVNISMCAVCQRNFVKSEHWNVAKQISNQMLLIIPDYFLQSVSFIICWESLPFSLRFRTNCLTSDFNSRHASVSKVLPRHNVFDSLQNEVWHILLWRNTSFENVQSSSRKTTGNWENLANSAAFLQMQKNTKLKYFSLTRKFANNCEWNLWRYSSYKTINQKMLRIYKLAMLSWEHLQRIQWSDAFLVTLSPLFVAVAVFIQQFLWYQLL